MYTCNLYCGASLVAQLVKNLPAMQETQIRHLGQKDPLEKGMAMHSSILAWRIPWTEEPGGPQFMGPQRVGHDWETNFHFHFNLYCTSVYFNFKTWKKVGTKDSVKWEDKNVIVSWLWDKSLILQNTRLKWDFFLLNPSLPSWKGHWLPWIYQDSSKRGLVLSAYTVWRNHLQLNVDTSLVLIASYEIGKESLISAPALSIKKFVGKGLPWRSRG